MILDCLDSNLDGDSWEELCDMCYRKRYQNDNYQKIPAARSGDAGIEGFTARGIVYQCYWIQHGNIISRRKYQKHCFARKWTCSLQVAF